MKSKTKNLQTRDRIELLLAAALPGQALAPEADAAQELRDGWFNALNALRLVFNTKCHCRDDDGDEIDRLSRRGLAESMAALREEIAA